MTPPKQGYLTYINALRCLDRLLCQQETDLDSDQTLTTCSMCFVQGFGKDDNRVRKAFPLLPCDHLKDLLKRYSIHQQLKQTSTAKTESFCVNETKITCLSEKSQPGKSMRVRLHSAVNTSSSDTVSSFAHYLSPSEKKSGNSTKTDSETPASLLLDNNHAQYKKHGVEQRVPSLSYCILQSC